MADIHSELLRTYRYHAVQKVEVDISVYGGKLAIDHVDPAYFTSDDIGMTKESADRFKADFEGYILEFLKNRLSKAQIEKVAELGGTIRWDTRVDVMVFDFNPEMGMRP